MKLTIFLSMFNNYLLDIHGTDIAQLFLLNL